MGKELPRLLLPSAVDEWTGAGQVCVCGGMEGVGVIGDVCGVGGLRQVSPHMWESGFLRKTFFSLRYKVTFLSGSL